MQHAIYLPPFGSFGDVHALVDLAGAAEDAGWDGFFLWDHIQYEAPVPLADAWVALSSIAASTSTIRLGPLVTPLPRRRPWKVAREAVTLDHLSRGRLVLGVGLGIPFWREFSSFAGEASNDAERARLLDDGIEIITRLWSGQPTTYRGERLSVRDAHFLPRPLQQPRIPIWSAALWPPARPGPIRRAARCDGVFPFSGAALTPAEAAQVRDVVARERGTDEPFDLCVWGFADQAAAYSAAGVSWLIESAGPEDALADVHRTIGAGPPR
ncbi:MAG: LLM class flavin-dependent oxidoreductase [Actinomycetota bacterium]|nr:LLM class flavin-dependent oxidoreductase [Actinomycetota bacterium]